MSPGEPRPVAPFTIRRAVLEDLPAMARVHVETWKTAYRGIVPDDRLDRLTAEGDISRGFGSRLREPPEGEAHFVAVAESGDIVGFAVGGPNRETDSEFTGELGALYILKSYQSHGVGTALVREVARHLLSLGKTSMIVWVLEQNPYRRFYERLGGVPVKKRTLESRTAGILLPEISYGWKDIRRLASL